MYSEEELLEARRWLLQRLRNERAMDADVLKQCYRYSELIAGVLMQRAGSGSRKTRAERVIGAVEGELSGLEVIEDALAEMLLEDCEILACDRHDDKKGILAWMYTNRGGYTLRDGVKRRCHTFIKDVAVFVMAGIVMGKDLKTVQKDMNKWLLSPWECPTVNDARRWCLFNGLLLTWSNGKKAFWRPNYGGGRETSSVKWLVKALRHAIADAWMWYGHSSHLAKGAVGYYTVRGSSYPCAACDANAAGGMYEMGDMDHLPPLHLHCVCMAVYVYNRR